MKPFRFSLNANRKALAITVIFGSVAFWTVTKVWAFNPQPDPPAFAAIQMLTGAYGDASPPTGEDSSVK